MATANPDSTWPDPWTEPVGGWPVNQSEPWNDAAPDTYPDENLLPVVRPNVPEKNRGEDDFKNPVVGV